MPATSPTRRVAPNTRQNRRRAIEIDSRSASGRCSARPPMTATASVLASVLAAM